MTRPPSRYRQDVRWPRRAGGAVATAAVLALMVGLWWWSGAAGAPTFRFVGAPLRLIAVAPPRPDPPPSPPPPQRPRLAGKRGGGHRARRGVIDPVAPTPFRIAGADAMNATDRPIAPPLATAAADLPVMVDATPLGPAGAASAGPGGEAGRGEGRGSGKGSGDGPGEGSGTVLLYTHPDWVVKPDDAMLRSYWPYARFAPVEHGRSALACRVRLSTRVEDCRVLAEAPARSGFGRAALAASHIFRVRPPRLNGMPVDRAWVLVTIVWNTIRPAKPGSSPTPAPSPTAAATPVTAP